MDPVTALRQIAYYKDRAREDSRRVMAYRNAADVVERLDDAQRAKHGRANSWKSLPDSVVELHLAAEDLGPYRCVPDR